MIVTEFYDARKDGVKLYRTYSDKNVYIRQVETGNEYSEAIDIEGAGYTYVETDEPINEYGTLENPITYSGNMVLENGKYYTQDGVVYLCNRGTGTTVYHALKDLVGVYVEVA